MRAQVLMLKTLTNPNLIIFLIIGSYFLESLKEDVLVWGCIHSFGYTQEVYERLVNKGKRKKLALIDVANKLIKLCFAMVKFGKPYDKLTFLSCQDN